MTSFDRRFYQCFECEIKIHISWSELMQDISIHSSTTAQIKKTDEQLL